MSNVKSIVYKFFLLIILMVGLNYLYKYTFFEQDLQIHSDLINSVRTVVAEKDEVVYLGESSNTSFRPEDLDKRSISDFTKEYFPSIKFGSITKPASHAGIYYELLNNIPENSSVKTIIVTLNLRSFDANWIYSNLETPLQKSMVLLKNYPPLVNRMLLAFRGYDIKTDNEREIQFKNKWKNDILKFPQPFKYNNVIDWDKGTADHGIRNPDGTFNQPLTELACHYVKTYAFQIDTLTNPRIKDFDKIVQLAKKRNWHLVFNFLAENIEKGDSLVGKELDYLIKQNRDLLVKRYHKNNVLVIDNLESLSNEEFTDQHWTTEHYSEYGRKIIAKNIAENLKKFYPANYENVPYKITKLIKPPAIDAKTIIEFTNNCEGNMPWGQMQTLTSEKSFAGEKSSKTGQGQDFSITFEYPIKNLPDSLKQISVNFQLFQNEINNDAKLIIEISGKNIDYNWNGFLIKDLSKTIQKWNLINYSFSLPTNYSKGDLIKIYVYNPSNAIIYVDDMDIKFEK